MDNYIQKAIDCLNQVLNIHENHIYQLDKMFRKESIKCLETLKSDGFK